ncbi:MAG: glycosyltransferase family 2 protein [Nitrospinaceae bacterium]
MNDSTAFSIIIPFKTWSRDLEECLAHIRQLSFRNYEVILLPDGALTLPGSFSGMPVFIIPTGAVNPAIKRDRGAGEARGEFLAFIDDDAYPPPEWLDVAQNYFSTHPQVDAIGGPAMTPKSDPFWARVSGAVFLSRASGGNPERYLPCPPNRTVDDWPSVNLIVRKNVFLQVGGFDSQYWPGEDTLFCLKLLEQTETRIVYVPELRVWHHRRPGLKKHLRQVGNYGLHRGFFAKRYPKTSRRLKYFLPALWVAYVVLGLVLSAFSQWAGWIYLLGWAAYLTALALSWRDIRRHESPRVALGAVPYIFLTHLWYGAQFVNGLTTRNLRSSLGR